MLLPKLDLGGWIDSIVELWEALARFRGDLLWSPVLAGLRFLGILRILRASGRRGLDRRVGEGEIPSCCSLNGGDLAVCRDLGTFECRSSMLPLSLITRKVSCLGEVTLIGDLTQALSKFEASSPLWPCILVFVGVEGGIGEVSGWEPCCLAGEDRTSK